LVFIYSFMFCLPISVAFCPAQANCLSLGEINSSQLVFHAFICYGLGFISFIVLCIQVWL
jgi:hypothetical protein